MAHLALQTVRHVLVPPVVSEAGLGQLRAQLAQGEAGKTTAYRIRYDGYASYGHITDTKEGIFTDDYDHLENFMTAVITKDGTAAGTVRVGVRRPGHQDALPAMEIFPEEIAAVMESARASDHAAIAVEVGRLARSPVFGRDVTILHAMFRTAGYLIMHHGAEVVLSAVRAHHRAMYARFGFAQISEPRQYPGLTCDMVLMACFKADFGDAVENLPFLHGVNDCAGQSGRLAAGEAISIPHPPGAVSLRPSAHQQGRARRAPAWLGAAPTVPALHMPLRAAA